MPLFFYGDDTFSLQHELKKIKEQFSFKHGPAGIEQCQLDEGDSDGETLSRLRQLFETQGLFAQKKLIIIKDFLSVSDSLPKSQEYLLDLFEKAKLVDEIVLVQILPFDRRRKIFKALVKLTQAKEFEVPPPAKLKSWIMGYLEDFSFKIDSQALSDLQTRMGETYNLWQVASELDKLMVFSKAKTITSEMVKEISARNINYEVFALTNSLAEGKIKQAMDVLDHLVAEGGSQQKSQTIQLTGAIASQLHSLLAVKTLLGTAKEKAEALGWKEGRVWINEKLAARFEIAKLKQLLSDLKQIDFRAKTSDEPLKLLLSLFIQKAKP